MGYDNAGVNGYLRNQQKPVKSFRKYYIQISNGVIDKTYSDQKNNFIVVLYGKGDLVYHS